jgi:D-sedoheptulose 7-phosphate isomerase
MDNLIHQFINDQIRESYEVKKRLLEDSTSTTLVKEVAQECVKIYSRGHKTLVAGNGGSASDAQHMAAELSGRFNFDRPGLPSISLTANTSTLTAISNDYGYDKVFSRQVQANGVRGDMFIGISTSGNSINILNAIEECHKLGIISVGLTGGTGGSMAEACDYCIRVPSDVTPYIQECHILLLHIICAVVEESLFGNQFPLSKPAFSLVGKMPLPRRYST